MKKSVILVSTVVICLLILQAGSVFAQNSRRVQEDGQINRMAQAIKTDLFTMDHLSFNQKPDLLGRGESLQVEFQIDNEINVDLELYIFVFATIEETVWQYNTFGTKRMWIDDVKINYFRALPANDDLYTYETMDEQERLVKYPRDISQGVDPRTNSPYRIEDRFAFRAEFLCHYRKDFEFFNRVTVLMFDAETDEIVFYRIFSLDHARRR